MEICKEYIELHEMIREIRVAMLTTMEANGCLRSLPMSTIQTECDGNIYFFTNFDSKKVEEIKSHTCVNVSYAEVSTNSYVSISGKADIIRDKDKMGELWKPFLAAWFPKGIDDPDLALLKVSIDEAEYWDAKESKMVQLWKIAKAAIKGEKMPYNRPGEHKKIQDNKKDYQGS